MSDTSSQSQLLVQIAQLKRHTAAVTERFDAEYGARVDDYRQQISVGLEHELSRFKRDIEELSGGNPTVMELVRLISEYVEWLQWTLWDLPHFAVALDSDKERLRYSVASCGMIYLSLRVLDDILDRHFWYRNKRYTLLATMVDRRAKGHKTEGLTFLGAMLMCMEGLFRLSECTHDDRTPLPPQVAISMLRRVTTAMRRVLVGMTMEESGREEWSWEFYERLLELKNVDYWRNLWAALDPEYASPLYPFLVQYYALAQKINDVQGHPADEANEQPNLVSLYQRREGEAPSPLEQTGVNLGPSELVERDMAEQFLAMAQDAEQLPELDRQVALVKLGESLAECYRLGLFHPPDQDTNEGKHEDEDGAETPRPDSGVRWYSTLEDVVEHVGPEALVLSNCPVCGAQDEHLLLRKQGFRLTRCADCTHVYVNPRLRHDLMQDLYEDQSALEDPFLDAQQLTADSLAKMLKERANGPRLLDIGFGFGSLMQAARATGFEVYGIEDSPMLIDRLAPSFGERLANIQVGDQPLPWQSFDVIVMTHVLEHVPRPNELVRTIYDGLRPGGLLYLAVPDIESVQFRIFGRHWDAICPTVHLQYFNERSLQQLLEAEGFVDAGRAAPVPLPLGLQRRHMQVFEKLGGSESGELAIMARRPTESDSSVEDGGM